MGNTSPIVRRDRRDSTWILRGPTDQVSSYLYYTGYAEPSTTKATQNTPIVRTWVTMNRYESYRVIRIRVRSSQCPMSQIQTPRCPSTYPKPSVSPCLRLGHIKAESAVVFTRKVSDFPCYYNTRIVVSTIFLWLSVAQNGKYRYN